MVLVLLCRVGLVGVLGSLASEFSELVFDLDTFIGAKNFCDPRQVVVVERFVLEVGDPLVEGRARTGREGGDPLT